MVRTCVLMTLSMLCCVTTSTMTQADGQRVVASMYHEDKWVATGARFDPKKMAVAHKSLPFGTMLTLSHGHRQAVVVVNDRGPYIRGRTLDLTPAANKQLECGGLCRLKMDYWPPLPQPAPDHIRGNYAIAWGEEPWE